MTFSWSLYLGLVGLVALVAYGVWRRRRVELFKLDVLTMRQRASDWADLNHARDDKGFVALDRVLTYASENPGRLMLFDLMMVMVWGWLDRDLTAPELDESLLDCVQVESPHEIRVISLAFMFRTGIYMLGESISGFVAFGILLTLGRLVGLSRLIPSTQAATGLLAMAGAAFTGGRSSDREVAIH